MVNPVFEEGPDALRSDQQHQIYYELQGARPLLVLVHGSWGNHSNWGSVVDTLAETFSVCTFDRRGHSQSQMPPGEGSVLDDADDLAGLVDHLAMGAAHIAGNSFGAIVVSNAAIRHPRIFLSLIANEPPAVRILDREPISTGIGKELDSAIAPVIELLEAGDIEAGAKLFAESVAIGLGAWDRFPNRLA